MTLIGNSSHAFMRVGCISKQALPKFRRKTSFHSDYPFLLKQKSQRYFSSSNNENRSSLETKITLSDINGIELQPRIDTHCLVTLLMRSDFTEEQAVNVSKLAVDVIKNFNDYLSVNLISKNEIFELRKSLKSESEGLRDQIDSLEFESSTELKTKINALYGEIEIVKSLMDSEMEELNYYTSLELNEHKNRSRDNLEKLGQVADRNQRKFNQSLNKYRIESEKERAETTPRVLWATTSILISLTFIHWLLPNQQKKSIDNKESQIISKVVSLIDLNTEVSEKVTELLNKSQEE